MLTNADKDLKVTPEQRKAGEQAEAELHTGQMVEKRIRETPTEGVGVGAVDMSVPGTIALTHDQLADTKRDEFAPVIPLGYEYDIDNRVVWVLSPYHYHMVSAGRVCHACLEWQSDFPTMKCSWRGKHEGCGADRQQVNVVDLYGRK